MQTLYIDDIDGSEAAGTVRFGLDGADYEIDLNAEHTKQLHTALRTYIDHARKTGGTSRRGPAVAAPTAPSTRPRFAAGPGNRASTSRTVAVCPPTLLLSTRRGRIPVQRLEAHSLAQAQRIRTPDAFGAVGVHAYLAVDQHGRQAPLDAELRLVG